MKYNEILHFQPITSVVKFDTIISEEIERGLVRSYIFSEVLCDTVRTIIIKNLDPAGTYEKKGIQIVGNYGTGKSHLMALVSAIAENKAFADELSNDLLKADFLKIAGKYKVIRFDIGSDKVLKDIVFDRMERWMNKSLGVDFRFDPDSTESYKDQLLQMMAAFKKIYPGKGVLVVIDELLEYLRSRNNQQINHDLMFLRSIGEACDASRFKIMFGVQELLYSSPEFHFQAETLNKVEDRYDDFIITREDVSFVVKERLLKKDEHQKALIRSHLEKFAHLYNDLQANFNHYVDLFPVHPSYIRHFENIRHGKSQREILKTLSAHFESMTDSEVPKDNPGLITYDMYWKNLSGNPSMMTIPDIRKVREISEIIREKINAFFRKGRAAKKPVAHKIADALAINLLCGELGQKNGATANSLKDDLCITLPMADDADFLLENIRATVKHIISATDGAFVDYKQESEEYYIRVEGGRNYDKEIEEMGKTMSGDDCDQAFFDFLQHVLMLTHDTYRSGFKIWEHSLEWKDKKSFRSGYIFFGNPNERSTTQPVQHFYLYFMPLFSEICMDDAKDEVSFLFQDLSESFKETIRQLGAAKNLEIRSGSDQKSVFRDKIDKLLDKARGIFDREYLSKIRVSCKARETVLQSFSLPGAGSSKEQLFSEAASVLLNDYFNERFPHYPAFKSLLQPLSKDNFDIRVKSAIAKIVSPSKPNRDGEAMLSGLGLWSPEGIEARNSKYALSLLNMLKERGPGKVLNRDEILDCYYEPLNIWYSRDFEMDYRLEFLVLAALVQHGDIEMVRPEKTINAVNIKEIKSLKTDDFFSFRSIRMPKGIPSDVLKSLFKSMELPDLTSFLENPETLVQLQTRAREMAERVVRTKELVSDGISCRNISLLTDEETTEYRQKLDRLRDVLDRTANYQTYGKLKHIEFSCHEIQETFEVYGKCDVFEKLDALARRFNDLVLYLSEARNYVVSEVLADDMDKAIRDLPDKLCGGSDAEIKQYETRLNALIDRYADDYLSQYLAHRLSKADRVKKEALLNSQVKKICDVIRDADYISNTVAYEEWIRNITGLKVASEEITKAAVKKTPFHDFNPREYQNIPGYKLNDLEKQLNDIFEDWTGNLLDLFNDPGVKKNMELLTPDDRNLALAFKNGEIELTPDNAHKLRDIMGQLARGIDKVELTLDDIQSVFKTPLSPDDAIRAFKEFINKKTAGKERKKVRIVIR